jgi:hypothetical protein
MQKYDATVTFFGGMGQEQTFIDTYRRGKEVKLSKTFNHDDAGTYIVGYQLSFGKGAGCEDKGFMQLYELTYDVKTNTCSFPYYEGEYIPVADLAEVDPKFEEEEAAAEEAVVEEMEKEEEMEEASIHTLPPTSSSPIVISEKCNYEYDIVCTTDGYSTTATVLFSVGENTLGSKQKYDATVTFFGGMDQGYIITDTYIRGEQYKLSKTFGHGDMETTYIVGYSLVYGEGAGCDDKGFTQLYELTYDVETKTCSLPYYEGEYIPVSDVVSELTSSVDSNASVVRDGPNSALIISASLALASCGIIFALGMYNFVGKKRKSSTAQCLAMPEMKFVEAACSATSHETKPTVESSIMHTAEEEGDGYFGTILIRKQQNTTIDDLSTLGDPMHTKMNEAVGMASDRNVLETSSTLISQQQHNITDQLEHGIGDLSTANQSCKSPMMFSTGTSLDVGVVDMNNLDLITVIAPKGKLGIMLDNPNMRLPVVYAVSESSVLRDKICIGDLLLAVDEVDCEGLSAHDVASILSVL